MCLQFGCLLTDKVFKAVPFPGSRIGWSPGIVGRIAFLEGLKMGVGTAAEHRRLSGFRVLSVEWEGLALRYPSARALWNFWH